LVAHFLDAEVDTGTGIVRVPRAILLSDTGTPINPAMVAGQLIGVPVPGSGLRPLRRNRAGPGDRGLKRNGLITDNKIPTVCEMPRLEIQVYFALTYESTGPFGAKGIGNNVLYNAIGIRFYRAPITPERVLAA
jgi:xanthine dehydrogenase molybdenum-binding subunit